MSACRSRTGAGTSDRSTGFTNGNTGSISFRCRWGASRAIVLFFVASVGFGCGSAPNPAMAQTDVEGWKRTPNPASSVDGGLPDAGQAGSLQVADVYGPSAMFVESLTCPEGSGEAGAVDYDVQLMKKHCMSFKDELATGPAAIISFTGEEVARANLLPNGKIKSCTLVKEDMAAALQKSRFRDFATACK